MNDPMTGKPTKERMVTTMIDNHHHAFEMFGTPRAPRRK